MPSLRSLGLLLLVNTQSSLTAQQVFRVDSNPSQSLPTKQLDDVRLRGYNEALLLADLSLFYEIPIGFEVAMNGGEFVELRMDLKKATLAEVLDRFVAEHPEYQWEISDGVVNVFPKEGRRDPLLQQILNKQIAKFSVKEKTATWDVGTTLLATPELKPLITSYALTTPGWSFSGFFIPNVGRTFKLDLSNTTVRAILNNIVKGSPTAKFWLISRNSAEHVLSISLSARHEDSPRPMRRADFEDLEQSLDLLP